MYVGLELERGIHKRVSLKEVTYIKKHGFFKVFFMRKRGVLVLQEGKGM
jgi:hypothetical protein